MSQDTIIREAQPTEAALITEHFFRMWRDIGVDATCMHADSDAMTRQFIDQVRAEQHYQCFMAEVGGRVVGSAGCQLWGGLYPNVFTPQFRKYGYIWGVYVEPTYRGRGIATALMSRALTYLKTIGCTRALLHASPDGEPVYQRLGFSATDEMSLDLCLDWEGV